MPRSIDYLLSVGQRTETEIGGAIALCAKDFPALNQCCCFYTVCEAQRMFESDVTASFYCVLKVKSNIFCEGISIIFRYTRNALIEGFH